MKKLLIMLIAFTHLTVHAQPLKLTQPVISEFTKVMMNEYRNGTTEFKTYLTKVLDDGYPNFNLKYTLERTETYTPALDETIAAVFRYQGDEIGMAKYLTNMKVTPAAVKALTRYALYAFAKKENVTISRLDKTELFTGIKVFRDIPNNWYYVVSIIRGKIVFRQYPSLTNPNYKDKTKPVKTFSGTVVHDELILDQDDMQGTFLFKEQVLGEANNSGKYTEYFECDANGRFRQHGQQHSAFGDLTVAEVQRADALAAAKKEKETEEEYVKPQVPYEEPKQEIFTFVEQPPAFPGGDDALQKYLAENLHYPKEAADKKIAGTVFVNFVVTTEGYIRDAKPVGPVKGGGLEEEAIRVVAAMPRWKGGKQNGKPVSVQFNLPIRFTGPQE